MNSDLSIIEQTTNNNNNNDLLKLANQKLGLSDDIQLIKNKNLIFVYCPPKVGSTSLVSSIRLYCSNYSTILHLHDEMMVEVICGITNVTINEIIQYNRFLGKNVTVIDIYRTPIEHKISAFFENISYHFNQPEEVINKYNINILIRRFNQLFPHLSNTDYYRMVYNLSYKPIHFDYEKKYIMTEENGIKYIKLRLQDAETYWSVILKKILGIRVNIIKDYVTDNKVISTMFKLFKDLYQIPENFLEQMMETNSIMYYLSPQERYDYFNRWNIKKTESFDNFSNDEYKLYLSISHDNRKIELLNNIQSKHYIDEGCNCNRCSEKRSKLLFYINNMKNNNCSISLKEEDYVIHKNVVSKTGLNLKNNNNNNNNNKHKTIREQINTNIMSCGEINAKSNIYFLQKYRHNALQKVLYFNNYPFCTFMKNN